MIITSLFLKAMGKGSVSAKNESAAIKKALAEIKEPARKYNREMGPPSITTLKGKIAYDYFKKGIKYDSSKAAYAELEKKLLPLKEKIQEPQRSALERVKTAIYNLPIQVRNAYDNTAGYGIAKYQNFKTTKDLKKNPNKNIGYVINGLAQNIGPGWRRSKELKEIGLLPYHLKSHHSEPLKKAHEKVLDQIKKLHQKAGVTEPYKRHDSAVGHSSGGRYLTYARKDPRTRDLGIKTYQKIASPDYGMRMNKLSHRLMGLVVDLSSDDVTKSKLAREEAVEMYGRKPAPRTSMESVAGDHDGLVDIKDTVDPHVDKHHILHHQKSTHFGTSGSDRDINKMLADLLMAQRADYDKKYKGKEYKMAA